MRPSNGMAIIMSRLGATATFFILSSMLISAIPARTVQAFRSPLPAVVLPSAASRELPIVFERNDGQSKARVDFLSRRPGYTLFLTASGSVMRFKKPERSESTTGVHVIPAYQHQDSLCVPQCFSGERSGNEAQNNFLRTRILGARPAPRVEGQRLQPGKSNYFIGKDPSKWLREVPQYKQVRYKNIYPGIDLVYHGNAGQLEYDFVLSPGANPNFIRLAMDGGTDSVQAKLTDEGDLSIAVAEDTILLHAPKLYSGKGCISEQGSAREFVRSALDCNFLPGGRFAVRRHKRGITVGFAAPPYDHRQPLVIDPVLSFSTFLGGPTGAGTNGVAVDAAGNIYVAGTAGADFPVTPGVYQPAPKDLGDVVIFKMSPDGSHLIYSTHLGGSVGEAPRGIAIDASGNAYVTGVTASPDFPTVNQIGPLPLTDNAFVSKLSPDGSNLLYSTLIGGNLSGTATGIAVDAAGEAVISGLTYSTDYPVTPGVIGPTQNTTGNESSFITKISADGKSFIFSTYLGANSLAQALGVGTDPSGNVYVTGSAASNFSVTPGAFQTTCLSPPICGYIVKVNPSGTALIYSSFLAGAQGRAIAVNSAGNAYVTGVTYTGEPFPTTPGAFQPQSGGFEDAFVTEFSPNGSALVYSTFLGGQNGEMGEAIAVDSGGNVSVIGETSSFDFPTQGAVQPTYAGDGDAFLSILNSTGSQLSFSTFLGGTYTEYAEGVAVDPVGNTYFVGGSTSSDFPIVNALQPGFLGLGGDVIVKVTNQPDFTVTASPAVVSLSGGQTATYSLTLTSQNGFNQNLTLSCGGAPAGSTCSISPNSVSLSGGNPASATVTVRTTARSLALREQLNPIGHSNPADNLPSLLAAGLVIPLGWKSRGRLRTMLGCTAILFILLGSQGCGGGSSGGGGGAPTPPGAYALTVTATAPNNLKHPAQLGLIVN